MLRTVYSPFGAAYFVLGTLHNANLLLACNSFNPRQTTLMDVCSYSLLTPAKIASWRAPHGSCVSSDVLRVCAKRRKIVDNGAEARIIGSVLWSYVLRVRGDGGSPCVRARSNENLWGNRTMSRAICLMLVTAVALGFSQSLYADPVYFGGPPLDVHSWQSGGFQDTSPGGDIDHLQFIIDTAHSPGATFEVGSSQLSSDWTVNTVDSNSTQLIANYLPGTGSSASVLDPFNLVFNSPQPPFVGIFYQLFDGSNLVENGYFYTGDAASANLPADFNGVDLGGGWGWSSSFVSPDSARIDAVQTPEPRASLAVQPIVGVGLIGLVSAAQVSRRKRKKQ